MGILRIRALALKVVNLVKGILHANGASRVYNEAQTCRRMGTLLLSVLSAAWGLPA